VSGELLQKLYADLGVSRETVIRLDAYAALLRKWQPKINLVSPDSLPHAETRHFADSIQILPLLKSTDKTLVDFGSGAGFPGLALALARPDIKVHMVESDARKGEFMKTVSRETSIPVSIHTSRIETLPPFPVDVISARALASLTKLFGYALPYASLNPHLRMIFMKGENWQTEVAEAKQDYNFDLTDHISITDAKARILVIENLSAR
jgi:16S rRNA (guanine527-N7)-methyltransferase